MPSLREFQIRCRRAFLGGEADALSALLRSGADASAAGLGVYQNNAFETFRIALAASYPVIADLVGDACFAGLAVRYHRARPSIEPDLQAFGERFPEFLDSCYANTEYAYLRDVARLERASEQVLLEPEATAIDAARLADIPVSAISSLQLVPSPAVRLVQSDYPILDIWRMHHRRDSCSISLEAGPSRLLVIRRGGDAVLCALSSLEYAMADRLKAGESVVGVFDSLAPGSSAAALQTALAKLLDYRLFTDVTIN